MTRVRFAPSNTGTLHIGGARTALYNWLVARQRKGTFVLRIEDTDLERSKPEYTENILASLRWLGIDWDEGPEKAGPYGPYFQAERARKGLYAPFIEKLMKGGGVYRCFCTKERLEALAAEQKARKMQPRYDRRCRSIAPGEAERRAAAGEASVVRLKLPDGEIAWPDGIVGRVSWKTDDMSDEVVIRSDGSPMYNFVVVCDDIEMKITDVIRGADHMSNTPKQIHIYDALGAQRPRFAHIPLIFGPNGKKLSKRAPVRAGKHKGRDVYVTPSEPDLAAWDVLDPRTGKSETVPKHEVTDLRQIMSQVDEYREAGYLPEAVLNYLALLGWGYDDKTEIFSREELVAKFDIEKVSSSPAQFDPIKLEHFQGLYVRKLPDEEVAARFQAELARAGLLSGEPSPEDRAKLLLLAKAEKERVRAFPEIVEKARPYFERDVAYDQKARENLLKKPGMDAVLADYRAELAKAWGETAALEAHAREFAKARGVKFGELVHPVRAALTGTTQGPGLFDVMKLVGRERTLERLEKAEAFMRSRGAGVAG